MSSNKTETVSLTETIIWFMLWLLKYTLTDMETNDQDDFFHVLPPTSVLNNNLGFN